MIDTEGHRQPEVLYSSTSLFKPVDLNNSVTDLEAYAVLPRPELTLAPAGALLGMDGMGVSFLCDLFK